jgi:ABC-2 type transport system ATP-binding protein
MIEGLRSITSGSIVLDGTDVEKEPYKVKEKIGIQLQSSAFFPNLSLQELLDMFSDLYGQAHECGAAVYRGQGYHGQDQFTGRFG